MSDVFIHPVIVIGIIGLIAISWSVIRSQQAWQKKHGDGQFFVLKDEKELGPYSAEQISEFMESGWLAPSDCICIGPTLTDQKAWVPLHFLPGNHLIKS